MFIRHTTVVYYNDNYISLQLIIIIKFYSLYTLDISL